MIKWSEDARDPFNDSIGSEFFKPHEMNLGEFSNVQYLNWEGFQGRLLSSSYARRPGEKGFDEMVQELKNIFDTFQKNGHVEFLYNTKLYYGNLG